MDLSIHPCEPCATLYGHPATTEPHAALKLNGMGIVNDARIEEHYTCTRCRAVFARILAGAPSGQFWMLLNAGQH
jgi:hypothetical protein